MLHEHRKEIEILKTTNTHFTKIFNEHNDLDQKIQNIENKIELATQVELENLKKLKLKLKDEIYSMILEYKSK